MSCNGETAEDAGTSVTATTGPGPGSTTGDSASETTNPTSGPDGTTAGTTSAGASSGPASTSGGETSSGETSSGGGTDTGGSSGEETSGGEETTAGVDPDYAAFFFYGGLDRMLIRKRDVEADLCTSMLFVWPGSLMPPEGFDLELPGEWGLQDANIGQGAADCHDAMAFPLDPVQASGGVGTGTWAPVDMCPPTVDIAVTLTFPPSEPWVPAMDVLEAQAIPVQGC